MKRWFVGGLILGVIITLGIRAFGEVVCIEKGKHHLIFVGPDASQVSEASAVVSIKGEHQITWQSKGGKQLSIEFKKTDLPKDSGGNPKPPFLGMKECADKDFLCFDCKANDECRSGALNPDLQENVGFLKCLKLKYYQRLDGKQADGWIIIKP